MSDWPTHVCSSLAHRPPADVIFAAANGWQWLAITLHSGQQMIATDHDTSQYIYSDYKYVRHSRGSEMLFWEEIVFIISGHRPDIFRQPNSAGIGFFLWIVSGWINNSSWIYNLLLQIFSLSQLMVIQSARIVGTGKWSVLTATLLQTIFSNLHQPIKIRFR